jgi:23S rRNA pseudouridine1911/1915/1917 synthase
MEIPILYEDEHIVAVNKPAGLLVHSDGKTGEKTLVDWIISKYPKSKDVGEPALIDGKQVPRPGIVHRLDHDTSGVLLIAKTKVGFFNLKKKFKNRHIKKIYRVFVYGNVTREDGMINIPIGRSKKDFRLWAPDTLIRTPARGSIREAITYYQTLGRSADVSFLEARPKTGRTHQIRVHLKAIGYPVVCDALYAPDRPKLLGFKRLALHAFSLSFKNLEGKEINVEAPYPQDFINAIALFKASVVK